MLIGEVASRTGVTTKTLRFYERQGLLPRPPRTPGGYRDYDTGAVDRVAFIKDAQAAGFTLAQIGEILAISDDGEPPCGHVTSLVQRRLDEVEQRLRELRQVRSQLRAVAERARDFDPAGCDGFCGLIQRPLTDVAHDRA
ncbi:MAG: heavy metal-responsive transcriptional regulator [Actinobacteria bacterium]|nr:heavy metal-responsive transcriptional regulator [Actinomycetota bacterium]